MGPDNVKKNVSSQWRAGIFVLNNSVFSALEKKHEYSGVTIVLSIGLPTPSPILFIYSSVYQI